jgi:hypothetical protein
VQRFPYTAAAPDRSLQMSLSTLAESTLVTVESVLNNVATNEPVCIVTDRRCRSSEEGRERGVDSHHNRRSVATNDSEHLEERYKPGGQAGLRLRGV